METIIKHDYQPAEYDENGEPIREPETTPVGGTSMQTEQITFTDLKKTVEEMKQAVDKLLQVTKELHETITHSWIK